MERTLVESFVVMYLPDYPIRDLSIARVSMNNPTILIVFGTDKRVRSIQESSSRRTDRRSFFVLPRRRLDSRRRCFEAKVGLVCRRGLGLTAALRSRSTSLAIASARFRFWLANRRASITSTPAVVILRPASFFRRPRTSSLRTEHLAALNRSWTAVATLFTFCPPGPEAWTKSMLIKLGSMEMSGVMRIILLPFLTIISSASA